MCAAVRTFSIGKFDLNPRGNLWAKDEHGLGRRLLSRMGWREGKGLGRGEDGITACIKVRRKEGHTGVGFTEKLPLGVENDAYNAVLESLNQKFKTNNETSEERKDGNGLELRSQQFKNRLHYQKFVRGKDVGRYSERDMSAIFVTRNSPQPHAASPPEDPPPTEVPTFKSQLSTKDYFAMKMREKSGEILTSNLGSVGRSGEKEDASPRNRTLSKKRKREQKSNGASKRLKSEQEEEVGGEEEPTAPKRSKRWGEKLKSCLKSKLSSSGLWFRREPKEVSFNDSVSYRIIGNVLEKDTRDVPDEDCVRTENHSAGFGEDGFVDNVFESTGKEDTLCSRENVPNGDNEAEGDILEELFDSTVDVDSPEESRPDKGAESVRVVAEECRPKCLDLPKSNNYNAWLESQRIAIKMKLYKNMVKKIRKNPVLKTSSILDLKGYGNWGF